LAFAIAWGLVLTPARERPVAVAPKKTPPPAPHVLLADLLQHDVRLAKANSPRERIEELANMADRLHGTAQTLAADADAEDMARLAALYRRVVHDGVVKQAELKLPPDQRKQILDPIASRLAHTREEAERLAQVASPETASPWRALALAAREGSDKLEALMRREEKR